MTLDDWIKKVKMTPENAEEFVKDFKRTYYGSFGGDDCDFQCSPQGLTLNGVLAACRPERGISEMFYKWDEVIERVTQPQQLPLW